MPSLIHEAPLFVLREQPSLVPELLRESLGVELPTFSAVDTGDAGFNQVRPAEFRADLVLHLRGESPESAPVMSIVVELQRKRDERKRRTWPYYVAALHARMRCPTCLVVIAPDEAIARWAARPIESIQPGSPFRPLVIGPDRIPWVAGERARTQPWLAALSALTHVREPGGDTLALDALAVLERLGGDEARLCYDVIRESLYEHGEEPSMESLNHEFKTERARKLAAMLGHHYELKATYRMLFRFADRYGQVSEEVRDRVDNCTDLDKLCEVMVAVVNAADRAAVEAVMLQMLPEWPDD